MEIIDTIRTKTTSNNFSKLALGCSILSLSGFLYIFLKFPRVIVVGQGIPQPSIIGIAAFYIFLLMGVVCTLLSYNKREQMSWYKILGTIINFGLLLIMVLMIVFTWLHP